MPHKKILRRPFCR